MSKTIIERMCSIAEKMRPEEGSEQMVIARMKLASADIRALAKALDLSQMQVVLLTAIVRRSSRYRIESKDIADALGLDYLKFLTYNDEMEGLRKRVLEAVKSIIGLTPKIILVGPGTLPRSEGKIKRVIDNRKK